MPPCRATHNPDTNAHVSLYPTNTSEEELTGIEPQTPVISSCLIPTQTETSTSESALKRDRIYSGKGSSCFFQEDYLASFMFLLRRAPEVRLRKTSGWFSCFFHRRNCSPPDENNLAYYAHLQMLSRIEHDRLEGNEIMYITAHTRPIHAALLGQLRSLCECFWWQKKETSQQWHHKRVFGWTHRLKLSSR